MLPDVNFSIEELRKSIIYIVIAGIVACVFAAITFEGEYMVGVLIERLFESLGIIGNNWLSLHNALFLHAIQIIFIITYLIELKVVIVKSTRNWLL